VTADYEWAGQEFPLLPRGLLERIKSSLILDSQTTRAGGGLEPFIELARSLVLLESILLCAGRIAALSFAFARGRLRGS
jgi:hypothetical protein